MVPRGVRGFYKIKCIVKIATVFQRLIIFFRDFDSIICGTWRHFFVNLMVGGFASFSFYFLLNGLFTFQIAWRLWDPIWQGVRVQFLPNGFISNRIYWRTRMKSIGIDVDDGKKLSSSQCPSSYGTGTIGTVTVESSSNSVVMVSSPASSDFVAPDQVLAIFGASLELSGFFVEILKLMFICQIYILVKQWKFFSFFCIFYFSSKL